MRPGFPGPQAGARPASGPADRVLLFSGGPRPGARAARAAMAAIAAIAELAALAAWAGLALGMSLELVPVQKKT